MQAGLPIYIVGGALRDMVLGSPFAKDLDFVVADCFEAAVRAFADRVHGRIIPWDFGQTRVVFQHGSESVSVDFSRCGRAGIIENLQERDFTINAMALDVRSLQPDGKAAIIDPLGGRQDLEAKIIRACSPQIFDNDPLRALRAIRFAAELGLNIEHATRRLLQQKAVLICRVARERVKRELFTILGLASVCKALQELLATGMLQSLIPELREFSTLAQGHPHEHDLLEHSLHAVRALENILSDAPSTIADYRVQLNRHLLELIEEGVTRRSLLIFAGLLHDSGKLATRTDEGGRISFYGHEAESARTNKLICARLGLGRRAQTMIERMSSNHMRPLQLAQLANITGRAKARALRDMQDTAPETLLLAMADCRATSTAPAYAPVIARTDVLASELAAGYFGLNETLRAQPRVTGQEVMEILGIPEGPAIGALLREIHELERTGHLAGKDDALQWLKKKKSFGPGLE